MNNVSEKRLVENEQIIREQNEKAKKMLSHMLGDAGKVSFHCECSDLNCQQRISLRISDYEKLHPGRSYFVVRRGHESTQVEEVTAEFPEYCQVKKFSL